MIKINITAAIIVSCSGVGPVFNPDVGPFFRSGLGPVFSSCVRPVLSSDVEAETSM